MRSNIVSIILLLIPVLVFSQSPNKSVAKWGMYEVVLKGPTAGNPFIGIELSAEFSDGERIFEPDGFYDGDGIYKIRFMPDKEGVWTYKTKSNRDELNGKEGQFGEYYLCYFGKEKIKSWNFELPDEALKDGMKFKVEIIDTWNMTITPVDTLFEVEKLDRYKFIDKKKRLVKLPGKSYMAMKITRIEK